MLTEQPAKSSIAIAAGFELASQSSGSNHSIKMIEPQEALGQTRRPRSCSSNISGDNIVTDGSIDKNAKDEANFAAIKAARAEVACLHRTHRIEAENFRQQIEHWKALATRKDLLFD